MIVNQLFQENLVTDPFLASCLRGKVARHDIRDKALKMTQRLELEGPKNHLKPTGRALKMVALGEGWV